MKRDSTAPPPEAAPPRPELQRGQLLSCELRDDPGQEYFVYAPASAGRDAPLLVVVHGISRNAREPAKLLARFADTWGVVLVSPLFSAERYPDYQRLGQGRVGKRPDVTLGAIVAEVAAATGASAARVHLFGFSGGARFAHRYAMANPDRVARAAIVCAGAYTFPDPDVRFPQGIGPSPDHPGLHFDLEGFLHVPVCVIVGRQDARDGADRRLEEVGSKASETPNQNALRWLAAMQAAAENRQLESQVSLLEIEGSSHSLKSLMKGGVLGNAAFESLFGPAPSPSNDATETITAPAEAPEDEGLPRARRLLRLARAYLLPLLLVVAALALVTPLGLWAHYRVTHVISRDALVRGHIADVGARLNGVVKRVEVDAGDRVREGQVVAQLEDRHFAARVRQAGSQLEKATRELEVERLAIANERRQLETGLTEVSADLTAAMAQVQAAESRAQEARRRLELQRTLSRQGLVALELVRAAETELRTSRALVEAARAEYEAAEAARSSAEVASEGLAVREERVSVLESEIAALRAELAVAEADLEGTLIRAPDDGAVVRRIVQPGGSSVVGQPIISLWVGQEVWVEAWIDEDDLASVAVGSPATVTLQSYPDREFTGVVESIGVSTDFELPDSEVPQPRHTRMRGTPLIGVRVRLTDPGEELLPGLSAAVGIRKQRR